MTYATITTTTEILETVKASHLQENQQLQTFHYIFNKLGKKNKAKKAC